jgi:hypothetical protein
MPCPISLSVKNSGEVGLAHKDWVIGQPVDFGYG